MPTFRLTVFDSNKEQYVTLISDNIPIQLEETSYKKTAIAKTSDSITTAPKDGNKIVENNSDILMIGNSLTPQWSIGTTPAWKNRYVWITHIILILLTITSAKFIKNRAQRTPIYEGRTPQQIINALKSKNLSPINFYIDAYECYEKIQPEIKNNDIKLTFENLSKKYEQIKYSGSNPVNLELPAKEEINTIIQELTKASK